MEKSEKTFYRGILGDTKDTIDAIQRFIEKHSGKENTVRNESPADSVNRVIKSIEDEDTAADIQKIIRNL